MCMVYVYIDISQKIIILKRGFLFLQKGTKIKKAKNKCFILFIASHSVCYVLMLYVIAKLCQYHCHLSICIKLKSKTPSHYLVFSLFKILFLSLISLKSFFLLSGLVLFVNKVVKHMLKIQTF